MEITQIILFSSIGVLTIVLALVGVQIIRILNEVKKTVEKTNKILDDMGKLSESIARPASSLNSAVLGLKTGFKILSLFLERKRKKKENE